MASWKDLYKHMCRGESAYQIAQALHLAPTRLARMMASKRLARMLELDERLAAQSAACLAAAAVRSAARQAGDAGGAAQPFSTVQNGTVSGLAVPGGARSCRKTPSGGDGIRREQRRKAIAANALRNEVGA